MAGIKSLAVRGIRSFGPDDSDEQRISFDTPLTLILGQNGCGKTTIIECLRYAVTGQMPPGSRNECFVHDAKVNRSSEVLGQVKLKIINAKDKTLEIARSLKVTALPNKKSKFQTLDSFLSVVDDSGSVKDISSRCADLDSMVHLELGVSKAILNSVIFCHQEDSNWPLDEGKKVKERFDEIFDADKYSDCFNKLTKIRKEYSHFIKMLTQEVAFLTEKKEHMDKKKLEQVDTETKISEAEIKIGELTQQLQPVTEKLKAIDKLQKDLVAFETKREKVKTRLEHCRTQETDLKATIKNILEGTVEELQKQFNEYGATAVAKKKEVDQSNKKIMSFNKDEEKIANQMTANEVKYNEMVVLERQNQERIDKKHLMIVETAKLAELEMETIENEEQAEAGIKTITDKIKSLQDELKEQKAIIDAEEKELQGHVDESRDALSRHKQKITGKQGDINTVKRDVVKTEKEIAKANESKDKLEVLEKNLEAAEEEYQNASKELNIDECQTEIADDEKVMEKHEQDLEALNAKVIVLQKQTAKLKEKDMVEESLKSKEKQLVVLKNKHRAAMVDLLGEMPEKDFAMNINRIETKLRKDIDAIKKTLKEKTTEITRLETERDHVRETLKERRSELTTAEDQMYRACGTQPYDVTLTKVTTSVETLQDDVNVLDSSMYIIKKYQKDLSENSCCPLCNRGFDAQNEVSDLISDLEIKMANVPSKLEKVREELQKAKAKKDDLLSLKTVNEKITKLKENDIPQLETRVADVDKKLVELNEAVDGLKMSMIEPEQKQQTAKQIQGDMPLMDRYNKEIQNTTSSLEALKAQCSDIDTEMTLDDATARQTDLRSKIATLRTRIKATQAKLNAHNKKLQLMMNKKNKMKEEMLNMQKKVQEIVTLQEKLKQLEEDKTKHEAELKELQEGVPALETAVKEKEAVKSAAVEKNRATLDVKRTYIVKIEGSFEKVNAVIKEIKAHIDKNVPQEMEKIQESNKQLMEKKRKLMEDRDELTKKIEMLKEELARQDLYKRDIKDNLTLKKNQIEAANCETELENIEKEICGVNKDELSEKEQLIIKQTELFRERATTEGSLGAMKVQLKNVKAELNTTVMKNVERQYREKFCELHVIKALDKDVKNYAIALEKCLMEYHKEKMENINLIIREMWRKIYRGNDIDYIEIKTESTMTMESERRKYDYRVVQCKNGVEIDLRGRCSAGQRVLACLIIRLALAETFSSRFGILALDEPTTNLDHENIRSLCSALAEIVQQRMRQKNFMFIIITHDKEFIESLGSIEKVTHYFEVSRNNEGKSRVKKIRFS